MANIKVSANTAAIAEGLYKKVQKMHYNAQRPLTVAISGGSSPKKIFNYWTENYSHVQLWHQILFFWVDERCVLPTDDESNFGEAQRLFFDHLNISKGNIHRIRGEENCLTAVQMYTDEMKRYVPIVNGLPQFDLVVLGMGADGHTASIFPGNEALLTDTDWCAVAKHPQSGQKRITLTGSVICNAKNILVLATGQDKAPIIKEVIEQTGNWMQYPISRIAPRKGKMCWLLDDQAASSLNKIETTCDCCS